MENTRNAYQLARLADAMTPDSKESPGAEYLVSLAEDFYSSLEEISEEEYPEDRFREMAEPSIATYKMWQQFVDIATQEDCEIDGTMEQNASYCILQIGERLLSALWEEVQQEQEREALADEDPYPTDRELREDDDLVRDAMA